MYSTAPANLAICVVFKILCRDCLNFFLIGMDTLRQHRSKLFNNNNNNNNKGLEDLEVGGRVETMQTTALLRTARILRRVLET